jgi:phosphoribosylformylglycinamidine cyclo-ligase
MGIGMVLIVPDGEAEKILEELRLMNYDSSIIGKVIKGEKQTIIRK